MADDHERDVMARAAALSFIVAMIRRAWQHIYHEQIQIAGESSEAQLRSCVKQVSERMQCASDRAEWKTYLDLDESTTPEKLEQELLQRLTSDSVIKDIGDVSPNQFRSAVLRVAWARVQRHEKVAVPLPTFLRACLKDLFRTMGVEGRIRVGANQHFQRMFAWLQEAAEETSWADGQGLKIRNAGGRGPVAVNPYDPKTLKVHLDRDYLPPLTS